MKSSVVAALAVVLAMLPSSTEAANGALYKAFVIANPTTSTLRYSIEWGGDGNWETRTILPGTWRAQACGFELFQSPPTARVRFDYVCGDDHFSSKTYRVESNFVTEVTEAEVLQAAQYSFRYSPSGRYLDLYKK